MTAAASPNRFDLDRLLAPEIGRTAEMQALLVPETLTRPMRLVA